MTSFDELKSVILKFGLKPTSSREMSLFSFSCIALGYTKFLRNRIGFSYEVVAAFGEDGRWHSFFNELHIAEMTGNLLKRHGCSFHKSLLASVVNIFKEVQTEYIAVENSVNALEQLKIIYGIYPKYFMCIGIYNCFWRYIGNDENKKGLTMSDIKHISSERDLIARFYPKVEKALRKCVCAVGEAEGFDGDLLQYLTHFEMGRYLNGELTFSSMMQELSLRREKYFYLYIESEDKEEVVTDKKVIKKICAEFYDVSLDTRIIQGFSVCKGVAQGCVYNMQNRHSGQNENLKNFVLVASSTHPDDVVLVKKCVAIVTDEGGILSHAAVISRELNKPCIIGTKIATKVLKDGDLVEVDANTGIVKIIMKHDDKN